MAFSRQNPGIWEQTIFLFYNANGNIWIILFTQRSRKRSYTCGKYITQSVLNLSPTQYFHLNHKGKSHPKTKCTFLWCRTVHSYFVNIIKSHPTPRLSFFLHRQRKREPDFISKSVIWYGILANIIQDQQAQTYSCCSWVSDSSSVHKC